VGVNAAVKARLRPHVRGPFMTEAILLSNVGFDSGRVTKRAIETGAHLYRFSDEAGVLIRLFVMKLSIADISHRATEPQRKREKATLYPCEPSVHSSLLLYGSVALWLISAFRIQ
jgi:hypothetical protein